MIGLMILLIFVKDMLSLLISFWLVLFVFVNRVVIVGCKRLNVEKIMSVVIMIVIFE